MTSLKQKYSQVFKKAREIQDTKGTKSPGNGQTCHNPSSFTELDKIPSDFLCNYNQRGNETAGLTVYFMDIVWDQNKFILDMVTQNVKNRKILQINVSVPKRARKGDWIETGNGRRLTVRTVFTQLLVSLHEYFRKKGMPYDSLFEMYQQYGNEFTEFTKIPKYFKDTWDLLNENSNENNNNNENNNDNDNNNNDDDNDVDNDDDNDVDNDIDQDIEIN